MAFSLGGFVNFLGAVRRNMHATEHSALERAGKIIEDQAKEFIGERQGDAGPGYPAWDPLTPSTIDGFKGHPGKADLGFSPPDYEPLYREGELHDSIHHTVSGRDVQVGSDLQVAEWQELGTQNMAARSFLGRAAFVRRDEVAHLVGRTLVDTLMGRSRSHVSIHAGGRDVTPHE